MPKATPQTAVRRTRSQSPPWRVQRIPVSQTQAAIPSRSISPYMWIVSPPRWTTPVCGEPMDAIGVTRPFCRDTGAVRPLSAASLAAALLLAAGCGHDAARRPVTAAEWKAVIRDWVPDRRFDRDHSCAAVREAVAHLPTGKYRSPLPTFRSYERKV